MRDIIVPHLDTPTDSLMNRLGAIFGDAGFGYFMSSFTAKELIFTLYNRTFCSRSKRTVAIAHVRSSLYRALISSASALGLSMHENTFLILSELF